MAALLISSNRANYVLLATSPGSYIIYRQGLIIPTPDDGDLLSPKLFSAQREENVSI
jgi:hypothetical protein